MKTLKKLLILLCLIYFSSISYAQLTLEHTFSNDSFYSGFEAVLEPIDLYVTSSASNNQLNLYLSDYSLYRTINVNLPTGYSLGGVLSSGRHIINSDNKAEFVIIAANPALGNSNNRYTMMIVNEDGQTLYNFGYNYFMGHYAFIRIDNQIKMIISDLHMENDGTYTYHYSIYACPSSPTNVAPDIQNNNIFNPFPNPTKNRINLPYKLDSGKTSVIRIFNMNGQMIGSYNIGSDFEHISIDVSNYAKGIYTYEYDGTSNKFVVE